MPAPSRRIIPPEAGYPGLPIDDAPPELRKAFAYLNDEIRPRREFQSDVGEHGEWRKVEFGKPGGELYPVFMSAPSDLGEFGLGIAMYFETLRLLCVTFFLCGLFQTQSISYYKSVEYSDTQVGVPGGLRGSAMCTRTRNVCVDEACSVIDQQNLCMFGQLQAYFDLTMTLFLFILIMLVSVFQGNTSAALDEDVQTAQDYSVIVDDPGPEDGDIEGWRDFFTQFGHVTFVTVAKDNGPLIKAMAQRRAIMREIIMMIGNGEASEDDAEGDGMMDTTWGGKDFKTKLNEVRDSERDDDGDPQTKTRGMIMKSGSFGMKPLPKWKADLAKANLKIQSAIDDAHYIPSKVFVTFETEHGQRACLKALSQGTLTTVLDWGKDKIDPNYLYNGTNVLSVKEAPEPSEIFWEDVDVTTSKRIKQQGLTMIITVLLIVGSVYCCKALQGMVGAGGAAMWITLTNIGVPMILRHLCFVIEDHVSANAQQMSLFLKLTFFRWMNTAVVIYLITDFDDFLTEMAVKQVQAVILADAITTPIIRTLNPSDLVNQLIICNYAYTQEKMNSYFLGTPWYVAERYADMTKTLFLALFYSAIFPAGLYMTCGGYLFTYTVDKYSLLRTWRTPAQVDDDITKISRVHMVFAIYCHTVMTMIFWAQFPFDNVCRDPSGAYLEPSVYDVARNQSAVSTDELFTNCDQSVTKNILGLIFGGSVTGKQANIVRLYALIVLCLSGIIFLVFFAKGLVMFVYHLFRGSYSAETDSTSIHFTSVEDIEAYIPIIRHKALAFPLVSADISTFESKYLPFTLPKEELYYCQSLCNINELPGYQEDEIKALFSEVRFFPPPEDLNETPASAEKGERKGLFGFGGRKDEYEELAK